MKTKPSDLPPVPAPPPQTASLDEIAAYVRLLLEYGPAPRGEIIAQFGWTDERENKRLGNKIDRMRAAQELAIDPFTKLWMLYGTKYSDEAFNRRRAAWPTQPAMARRALSTLPRAEPAQAAHVSGDATAIEHSATREYLRAELALIANLPPARAGEMQDDEIAAAAKAEADRLRTAHSQIDAQLGTVRNVADRAVAALHRVAAEIGVVERSAPILLGTVEQVAEQCVAAVVRAGSSVDEVAQALRAIEAALPGAPSGLRAAAIAERVVKILDVPAPPPPPKWWDAPTMMATSRVCQLEDGTWEGEVWPQSSELGRRYVGPTAHDVVSQLWDHLRRQVGAPAPDAAAEAEVLSLRQQLADAKADAARAHRTAELLRETAERRGAEVERLQGKAPSQVLDDLYERVVSRGLESPGNGRLTAAALEASADIHAAMRSVQAFEAVQASADDEEAA